MTTQALTKTIKIAHSPDSDDAFMFYAIKHKKIDLKGYQFEISSDEIDILNQLAQDQDPIYDIFAVSFHAYAYIKDRYEILKAGASMAGKDYGPKLVAKTADLPTKCKIAVPGRLTSAFLVLQQWLQDSHQQIQYHFCSYNEVFSLLESDQVDASLLIHESQLRYQDLCYKLIVDLGSWWYGQTNGLKMPLGCNVISKDLGNEVINDIDSILRESIEWGLANFDEVLEYSRKFADNKLDDVKAKRYIEMYVNESTVELSQDDFKSINLLINKVVT